MSERVLVKEFVYGRPTVTYDTTISEAEMSDFIYY